VPTSGFDRRHQGLDRPGVQGVYPNAARPQLASERENSRTAPFDMQDRVQLAWPPG
jgi:hypothetical protein